MSGPDARPPEQPEIPQSRQRLTGFQNENTAVSDFRGCGTQTRRRATDKSRTQPGGAVALPSLPGRSQRANHNTADTIHQPPVMDMEAHTLATQSPSGGHGSPQPPGPALQHDPGNVFWNSPGIVGSTSPIPCNVVDAIVSTASPAGGVDQDHRPLHNHTPTAQEQTPSAL